jgi:hypothetical protein
LLLNTSSSQILLVLSEFHISFYLSVSCQGPKPAALIDRLKDDVAQARDSLLLAKITQVHHASRAWGPDPQFCINDLVMLATTNRWHEYKKKGEKRTAKFFLCWDGPYRVTGAHPEVSTYTLNIPMNQHLTFHASELKRHLANDAALFPSCELAQPGPILTPDGMEEYLVEQIIDSY